MQVMCVAWSPRGRIGRHRPARWPPQPSPAAPCTLPWHPPDPSPASIARQAPHDGLECRLGRLQVPIRASGWRFGAYHVAVVGFRAPFRGPRVPARPIGEKCEVKAVEGTQGVSVAAYSSQGEAEGASVAGPGSLALRWISSRASRLASRHGPIGARGVDPGASLSPSQPGRR